MKEHTGKQGFAALCMSLFFIFLFFGSALFTAQLAQNIQGISLRSRFCDDTSLACGLLNPPEQFHLQRGNPNSKTGLRTQPFYGAAGGNSAALQDLILSLAVSAAFLRNPDFRPSIRFFTKHCPVGQAPYSEKTERTFRNTGVQIPHCRNSFTSIQNTLKQNIVSGKKGIINHGCMVHANHSVRGIRPARTLCFTGRFSDHQRTTQQGAQ